MKNSLCPGILAVVLLSTGSVPAQVPTSPSQGGSAAQTLPSPAGPDSGLFVPGPVPGPGSFPGPPGGPDGSSQGQGGGQDSGPPPYAPGLSPYVNYLRPCGCCGPVGAHGPILYELYTRHGVSEPVGGGTFGKALAAGYMGQIGGRTLFFDATRSWAFTVDVGLATVWWDAGTDVTITQRDIPVTFTVSSAAGVPTSAFTLSNNGNGGLTASATFPSVRVVPSSLHQIYGNLSAGQEFYMLPPAACCSGDCSWRIGYDAGVRWGTAKVIYQPAILVPRGTFGTSGPITDVVGLQHGNDVVKGGFFALHTDVEVPYKCCFFYAGLRAEIAHIRSDILQPQNNSNLTMINILGTFGLRF